MEQQANEIKITFTPKIDKPKVCSYYSLTDVLQMFKTGKTPDGTDYREIIEDTSKGNKERKNELPVIVFGGEFSNRSLAGLTRYSGMVTIDFDHLEPGEMAELSDFLRKDPYILACWKSPSAKGIKALVKVPRGLVENHKRYFSAILEYLESKTGVIVDRSGSDVSRACYACYDPEIHYRPDSLIWDQLSDEEEVPSKTATEYNAPPPALVLTSDYDKFEWALRRAQKNKLFNTGRNNTLFIVSVYANMAGVPESAVISWAINNLLGTDFNRDEINRTVVGTYTRQKHNHNTILVKDRATYDLIRAWRKTEKMEVPEIISNYFGHICQDENDPRHKKEIERIKSNIQKAVNEIDAERVDGFLYFWNIKTNEDTGKTTLQIDYNNFRHWLRVNGFFRYKMNEGSDEILILCDDTKVVRQVRAKEILPYMTRSVDALPPVADSLPREQLFNFTVANSRSLLDEIRLQTAEQYYPQIYRDDKDRCYFIFRNQIYSVTRDEIRALNFTERDKFVWSNNILQYNIFDSDKSDRDLTEFFFMKDFHFGEWVYLLCKRREDEPADETTRRALELCAIIGYNLHTYKDPANPKATILTEDQKDTRPHGGTGKSLIVTAISKLRKTAIEDGKNFNLDSTFAFQQVELATQIVWIDDLHKSFNFERLFPAISNGLTVEKKNQPKITLTYSESPKFIFTTNYSLRGNSDSFTRRQYIFELSQYFKDNYGSPYERYGKRFFDDWNANEWNTFFIFMMKCAQYYMLNGIVNNVSAEYRLQQLISALGGQENYDIIRDNLPFNTKVFTSDLYGIVSERLGKYAPKKEAVNGWVREYAYFHNAEYESVVARREGSSKTERAHYLRLNEAPDESNNGDSEGDSAPENTTGFNSLLGF